jgi:Superfamily I DNA and RNA helicases and helicase subunits
MLGQEDLFNIAQQKVNTLAIRFGDTARQRFDSSNKLVSFDKLMETLTTDEWDCYFTKRNESEIQISVPTSDPSGQFDLVVKYNEVNHLFELEVHFNTKTKFRSSQFIPNPEFSFQRRCRFAFVGLQSGWSDFDDLSEMNNIFKKAMSLEISPNMASETQLEIWDEYIEAQSQLIDRLYEPYELIEEPKLTPEKSHTFDGNYRYKLECRLRPQNHNEYEPLREKLSEALSIETDFDSEGISLMKLDDIYRGLDSVIRREFPDRYERDPKVGCVLSIRPFTKAEKIQEKYSHLGSFAQRGVSVLISDLKVPIGTVTEEMSKLGYAPAAVSADYSIDGVENLYQSEHVERFSITFSDKGKPEKGRGEKEMILPEPTEGGTKYHLERKWNDEFDMDFLFFRNALGHIYGKENVHQTLCYRFNPVEFEEHVEGFTEEQWADIKKDFYSFGWDYNAGDAEDGKLIGFDFETEEEMRKKYADIAGIGKFVVRKSPLDPDFNFKVTTHLTAKKTAQQIFRENIEKLNGAEFVYEYREPVEEGEKPKRPVFYNIGKLNSFESSMDKLVLYIPNVYKEDQEKAEEFLKFFSKHPRLESIHANLAGDRAKIEWLKDAMKKLHTTGSWMPNSTPVNENIKDFIFDSSKAEEVFRYMNTSVTETEEFRDFDRTSVLSLNDSQKEAVLKAVAARDLCMLQGPPGTGKTTVIAELIWQHIRENQASKLLLTSETNLAVDNALEKLMNGKAANPEMARYLTLIKPLRFGKSAKFEEEGKRYSLERIEKWIDGNVERKDDYEEEVLSGENALSDAEEIEEGDPRDNVVQKWMTSIAERSAQSGDRYRDVLKDWQLGLSYEPDVLIKEYFRDLYLKHVNVVGSTCSSTGSPAFMGEYMATFHSLGKESLLAVKKSLGTLKKYGENDRTVNNLANILEIDEESLDDTKNAIGDLCSVKFDTVIMDEASKATPPELMMPLCFGRKSIVIGDHRQLPPMLNEKSFKEALNDLGTDKAAELAEDIDRNFVETSQFKRMITNPKVSKTIKATFNTQYRMHPRINDVISQFYANDECGGLHCGLDPMKVDSPDLNDPQSRYHGFNKAGFINPGVHTIWINVDAPEAKDGSSRVNDAEIKAINRVLELLKESDGFAEYMSHWDSIKADSKRKEEKEIGVISFYGKQVRKIRESVRPHARQLGMQIKMNTVDKFQGMERNIVIVSTVRSNKLDLGNGRLEDNRDSGFAKSPERLNVALSRARRLLIVVGNKDFFSGIRDKEGNYLYRNAIQEIERTGKVIDIKELSK